MPRNIVPQLGQHSIAVGKTGSGKTTTTVELLRVIRVRYPIVIIDTKGERAFDRLGGHVVTDPRKLTLSSLEIYRPEGAMNTAPLLDSVLDAIYQEGRSLYVYIDELYNVSGGIRPRLGLSNILMRGRERTVHGRQVRLSLLQSTQRPSWIPGICFTESTHFYCHRLQTRKDRKTIADHLGEELVEAKLTGHEFFYYTPELDAPVKTHITLARPSRERTA